MTVSVMWLFLAELCIGLLCVVVVFPGHTHLLFWHIHSDQFGYSALSL